MKTQDFLNYSKAFFYILLGISIIVFIFISNTFNKNVDELGTEMNNILDKMKCDIDFKEFHYSGICINSDKAFNFINSYYNNTLVMSKVE